MKYDKLSFCSQSNEPDERPDCAHKFHRHGGYRHGHGILFGNSGATHPWGEFINKCIIILRNIPLSDIHFRDVNAYMCTNTVIYRVSQLEVGSYTD